MNKEPTVLQSVMCLLQHHNLRVGSSLSITSLDTQAYVRTRGAQHLQPAYPFM